MKIYDTGDIPMFGTPVGTPLFECEPVKCGEVFRRDGKVYAVSSHSLDLSYARVREISLNEAAEDTFESELTCPACGYRENDSWELSDSDDEHECGRCGAIISFERDVVVNYSASLVKPPAIKEVQG